VSGCRFESYHPDTRLAELEDAADLKSVSLILSAGSTPATGTDFYSDGGIGRRAVLRTRFLVEVGVQVPFGVAFMAKTNAKVKIIWPKNYLFNSFWAPKVINRFITKGNKESIEKEFFVLFKSLKKITTNPTFLLLGLIKSIRPAFGLKIILNKITKLQETGGEPDAKNATPLLKYIRIPIFMRTLRGLKLGICWFKESCLFY
jgi:hypothetical protein